MEDVPIRMPCLPGYSLAQPPAASYAKKQTLKFANGIAVPAELRAPGAAAAAAELQAQLAEWKLAAAPSSAVAPPVQPFVPKYVALDKQVLRFDGYITEVVPDSPLEAWRVRRVQLLCYLEDGSCQVVEPPMPNSGLVQGTLVRRHVLPRDGGGVLGPADLAVGAAARIYGRDVHLTDVDAFTREHYATARRVTLAPAQPVPPSPIDEVLAAKSKPSGLSRADEDSPSKFAEALLGREFNSKSLQQFLQHGDEVLRFYMLWTSPEGTRFRFKLHFFVADSTAEMMKVSEAGSGPALFPTFLKRAPLPKVKVGGRLPGQTRLAPDECYAPADLRVGATVAILGRSFLIYDCDEATRAWYTDRLGFSPAELSPIDVSEPAAARPEVQVPPYTGIGVGSPEDSIQNCLRLIPKPPKKDQYRWQQLDHVVFRYSAVLEPGEGRTLISTDTGRAFVLSYHLADQTLAVFEPSQPNTGIMGGKFLERGRVYKPGNELSWFTEADLAVGRVLELHGRRFRITGADQFTEQYRAVHG